MKVRGFFLALGAVSLLGCGGSSTGPGPQVPLNTPVPAGGVTVNNDFFTPATKTVTVNTTVQWAWNTCGGAYGNMNCASHSVTLDDGTADSGVQQVGTFSHAFTVAGTYPYHCRVHPTMTGTITVQ